MSDTAKRRYFVTQFHEKKANSRRGFRTELKKKRQVQHKALGQDCFLCLFGGRHRGVTILRRDGENKPEGFGQPRKSVSFWRQLSA